MGITISITVNAENENESIVNAAGSVEHIISDTERSTFQVTDSQLKQLWENYKGRWPTDAYLHSPTPWDLYEDNGWPQTKTVLVAEGAEILGITSEPTIVKAQEFVNNSSVDAEYHVVIQESVNHTASSQWSVGGELTIGQSFEYGVSFLGTGVTGESSLSYTQSWGVSEEQSTSVTVGSESGVTVTLKPGQGVIAKLTASRGVMRVRVTYLAYLSGVTAVNYYPELDGHYFWAQNVGYVMSNSNVSNAIQSTEDIEVGYYSNSRIELIDIETNDVIATYDIKDLLRK